MEHLPENRENSTRREAGTLLGTAEILGSSFSLGNSAKMDPSPVMIDSCAVRHGLRKLALTEKQEISARSYPRTILYLTIT